MPRRWLTSLRASLVAVLACAFPARALAAPEGVVLAFVVEGGAQTEAIAWRDGDAILVDPSVFSALGIKTPEGAGGSIALSALAGLSYRVDDAKGAVIITCTAQCYEEHEISVRPNEGVSPIEGTPLRGLIVNYDIVASEVSGARDMSGLIETVWAAPNVTIENTIVANDDHGVNVTRLDSALTIDLPTKRTRVRLGDNVTSAGAWGAQTRFAGVRFGTDFSLDPAFVSFPTPALKGQSAAPAAADLYVDNALRYSQNVPAGPFALVDAPMISGAGLAQLVVTDVLGRQQIISSPFYVSPSLLRARLTDFSVDLGFERTNFGQESADYGDDLAAITVRHGFENGLTGEVRGELGPRGDAFGLALSGASYTAGQIDIAIARSEGKIGEGQYVRVGLTRAAKIFSVAASYEAASAHFSRQGDAPGAIAVRGRGAASLGWVHGSGGFSLSLATEDSRDSTDLKTLGVSYVRDFENGAAAVLSALQVEGEEDAMHISFGLSVPLGNETQAGFTSENRDGEALFGVSARANPREDNGWGWRAALQSGAGGRADLGASYLGRHGLIEGEASRAYDQTGLRLRLAGGLAFADNTLFATRTIGEAFALVRTAPGMDIALDNRIVGRTDLRGRLLVTGLRAYSRHQISIDPTQAPIDSDLNAEVISTTPRGRAGVLANFPLKREVARWVTIVSPNNTQTPIGLVLTREADASPFFVGSDGRAYLAGLEDAMRFRAVIGGQACVVDLAEQSNELLCRAIS